MNLRQLEHLVTLADEGAFARAAEKLHLSQPALTRSIQALEETLDLQLCDRHYRGIDLTPAGKLVVERARRVLLESRALDRDIKLFKGHSLGDVRFGVGPYPATVFVPGVIARLSQSCPQLALRTEAESWDTLLERLHGEAIDFFIAEKRAVPWTPKLAVVTLSTYECGWFARPQHPIFEKAKCTTANLREARIAAVPVPEAMREELRKRLRYKPSENLEFSAECNNFTTLKEIAECSDTAICGPLVAVRRELTAGTLRRIVLEDAKAFSMQFAIAYLAHRTLSPMAEKAIEAIVEYDRQLKEGETID
ncbi:LysR family transcriptional regulator [Pseudomonas izuensis]|uniref:LysR family transcriptional regulator n=1 Tax=Pseudomonas izuensis TaxID=2684212 RepID=A0ABM7RWT0_9PSED|nr:LysR family transcriptional regulator [Pseudomonas izuensis]BCX68957.1 LysR family transcriptional regulator [Pseudomonas izuensis]